MYTFVDTQIFLNTSVLGLFICMIYYITIFLTKIKREIYNNFIKDSCNKLFHNALPN